ncbi:MULTISPECIES: hypothetical protein [unclassified Mesorhizobium]|uniref:hypothetical protein n=1 Tax=unclassified Mesorhizobium TaxID=325217 RepID=UPI000FCCA854|nr:MULTISPECIES: hypothetical protein [unclassified Mesorhizobium]RUT82368.1 hypothetical protein EOD14_27650 [Mesorhizobium sp. M7A.T.Ca.US.000.02.1.1]RUT90930.1 hypothetical protein EOD15_16860 [Mesorhizobium sp. M7A.T.Ca.US.000.02.2.1]RUV30256.1 hypothetical protein EOB49_34850 [Mesorhizobium sp. M7A.F.Ca.MR.148.00.0.0]
MTIVSADGQPAATAMIAAESTSYQQTAVFVSVYFDFSHHPATQAGVDFPLCGRSVEMLAKREQLLYAFAGTA